MRTIIISFFTAILMVSGCKSEDKPKPPVIEEEPQRDTQYVTPVSLGNAYATVDVSPMDMAYFPVDYPKLKMANPTIPPPVARVIYSRPHLQGRQLFHDVLKYGEAWRLGANESTEIELYRDVTINGKKVSAGRYILYCILGETKWEIVFNSELDSWGLKQNPKLDVARFEVPVTHGNPELEYFTIVFEKSDTGAHLLFGWDDVIVRMPMTF